MRPESAPVGSELVDLDRGRPLQEQLERSLREAIRGGRLRAGDPLPSSRSLATALGVSRGIVSGGYGQLAQEGYLDVRQGAPVRVSGAARAAEERPPARSLHERFDYDLRPGIPDLAGFPHDRWLRSLRTALRAAGHDALGPGDPRGRPELREALAGYLGRVRSASADPERLVVCTGARQGLALAMRALRDAGVTRVAVEDPGRHVLRLTIEQVGLDVVPIPVDDDGLDVTALAASAAEAVLVTPAHHFPTGAVLGAARRSALLEWAERGDHLVVEHDPDAELHHERVAVGALQGLAPDRVLHVGSASERLAPGLRIGWMLTPTWLGWSLVAAKSIEDGGSEVSGQLALADFIARGELERHLRRMRASYRRRRAVLLDALARELPTATAHGSPAGTFELLLLPGGTESAGLARAAGDRGVGVQTLGLHRFRDEGPDGLVLGYAALAEPALRRALSLLASAAR